MKKKIIVSIVFFYMILNTLNAQDKSINWYSFEEAVKMGKKNPKKVFIDIYTDWCGWCKKMDATTFKNPIIAKYLNENYYPVKMDAEQNDTITFSGKQYVNPNPHGRRSSHQLAIALLQGKMSYPSYVFLNEKFEMLTVVKGYIQKKDFETVIKFFGEDAHRNMEWEKFKASFQGEIE